MPYLLVVWARNRDARAGGMKRRRISGVCIKDRSSGWRFGGECGSLGSAQISLMDAATFLTVNDC